MGVTFNPFTGTFDFTGVSSSGTGDVTGPASSTDNAITRFDGTTGKIIQNSLALLQDGGATEAQGYINRRIISNDVYIYTNQSMVAVDPELTTGDIILEGSAELYIL